MDVVAVGLACPVGLLSITAWAAIRAGRREIELLDEDGDGDVRVSRLDDGRDVGRTRAQRAAFFCRYALRELFESSPWTHAPGVYLAAPEPGPTAGLDVEATWAEVRGELHLIVGSLPSDVRLFPSGRAGVFEAIAVASEQLQSGAVDLALVGGFDSQVDAETLSRLDHRQFVPGEGAAFLLLERSGGRAMAQFADLALARDKEPFAAGTPCRAAGLTDAFSQLSRRTRDRVDVLFPATPMRGWWASELNYAYLRNADLMPEPMTVTTLHEHIGDLGAAAGAAALVTAVRALNPILPGRAPDHRSALVHASSHAGVVGAARLLSTLQGSP